MLGVYAENLTGTIAEVLHLLGVSRAMVVFGSGLDEITVTGETTVTELYGRNLKNYTLSPEQFGLLRAAPADLLGGDPEENARIIRAVLAREKRGCTRCRAHERPALRSTWAGGQGRSPRESGSRPDRSIPGKQTENWMHWLLQHGVRHDP